MIALAGLGLVAALVVAGIIVFGGGEEPAPAPSAEVSRADAKDVVERFADAYSAESIPALRALFAPSFKLKNDDDPIEDRSAALDSYAIAFNLLTEPRYRVSDLSIAPGAGAAGVTGQYRITSGEGWLTGLITFQLNARAGELLISRITTTPQGGGTPTPSEPNPAPGSVEPGSGADNPSSADFAQTVRVKTWYSTWSGSYVHFKAVDESTGRTVAEAIGSDNVDLGAEQAALRETPKRHALVDELREKLIAAGWTEIGVGGGGEWYEIRFGR